ncbi:MAG: helix-turn-helix domain-containing protein [Rhodoplanes sp.]
MDKLRDLQCTPKNSDGVKVGELVRKLGLNQTTVNRRLIKLVANGFVENLNPGKGKTGRYRANAESEFQTVLPSPDELFSP